MNKKIIDEINNNLYVREDLKNLFANLKSSSNGSLLDVNPNLFYIKFSTIFDDSFDDIFYYLFYLKHSKFLSIDELKHLIEPLKEANDELLSDSKELSKKIESISVKINSNDIEKSINELSEPKNIYERYILQRALFEFDCFINLK